MLITVREVVEEDWLAVWPLLEGAGVSGQRDEVEVRFHAVLSDPRWQLLVAERDGELVGYAALQDYGPHLRAGDSHRAARLHDVFVRPSDRRAGVGRALMAAVVRWAAAHVVHLEWQAHEERAAPFYERLGFKAAPCPQPEYPYFEVTFTAGPADPAEPASDR